VSKSIETLVEDVYGMLSRGEAKIDGVKLGEVIAERLAEERGKPTLRMSNFATPDKQLWFAINKPELAEPLPPQARLKFMYGHILEELLLDLAEQAGHKVEGRQDEVSYAGITGHFDAIIDGVLIDVKSANSRSFEKFRYHKLGEDDAFGYLDQLSLYLTSTEADKRITNHKRGAFFAIDKELGHLCLDMYDRKDTDYAAEIKRKLEMLRQDRPPNHCCDSIPLGASGNLKLGVRCSYNPYKWACHPELRAFKYASRTEYLTKVTRVPDVEETTAQWNNLTYSKNS